MLRQTTSDVTYKISNFEFCDAFVYFPMLLHLILKIFVAKTLRANDVHNFGESRKQHRSRKIMPRAAKVAMKKNLKFWIWYWICIFPVVLQKIFTKFDSNVSWIDGVHKFRKSWTRTLFWRESFSDSNKIHREKCKILYFVLPF